MPRGTRRSAVEIINEQLTKVQESIAKKETELKELKNKEKELKAELKKTELDELIALMGEKDISVSDIRNLIEGQQA